jgi:hypothetical protein
MTIKNLTGDDTQGVVQPTHPLVERINELVEDRYDELLTSDQTVYIDAANGSDDTGHGTQDLPWATFDRALRDVPRGSVLTVRPAVGTYTSFPQDLKLPDKEGGTVVIDASHNDPAKVAGPFTLTSVSAVGAVNATYASALAYDYDVSGAGWTIDAYAGKHIRFLTGTAAGYMYPIYKNTATALRGPANWQGATTGDIFEIVEEPVTIAVGHPIYVSSSRGYSDEALYAQPQLACAGIKWTAAAPYASGSGYSFTLSNTLAVFSFCSLINSDSGSNSCLYLRDSNVNNLDLTTAGFAPFASAKLNDYFNFSCHIGIQGGGVPTVTGRIIFLSNAMISAVSCRGTVFCRTGNCWVVFSLIGNLDVYFSRVYASFIYADTATITGEELVNIHQGVVYMESMTVDGWTTYIAQVRGGELVLNWLSELNGTAAYAIGAKRGAHIARLSVANVTAAGSTNAIHWMIPDTGAAWPASGAGANDGTGCFASTD